MDYAYPITLPTGFIAADADLARLPVDAQDGYQLARTTTDWIFDASQGGYAGIIGTPGNGTNLPAGGMLNLANDNPLALPAPLRGAVTLKSQLSKDATVERDPNGYVGIEQAGGTNYTATLVQKVGIADTAIGHPPTEGFRDFVVIAWLYPYTLAHWSPIGCGNSTGAQTRFWGLVCSPGGVLSEVLSLRPIPLVTGKWQQVAMHYRYDVAGNKIYVRTWLDGEEISPGTFATPVSMTPTAMAALPHADTQTQIGGNNVDQVFDGLIGRLERIFTGIAGHTLDPAQEVAVRNWTVLRPYYGRAA